MTRLFFQFATFVFDDTSNSMNIISKAISTFIFTAFKTFFYCQEVQTKMSSCDSFKIKNSSKGKLYAALADFG